MPEKITLAVQKRTIDGKKVKQLRRQGILPANIFGKGVPSQAIQLPELEFMKLYKKAGETHLIEIAVDKQSHNVLIHNVQIDPLTQQPLHVDFQAVSLREKITATVPIQLVGEAPAEKEKVGILVQQLSEIDVEALPQELPDHLEIDISTLVAVNDTLYVRDLKFDSAKVTIKPEDREKIVARIEPPAKEEVITPPVVAPAEGEIPAAEVSGEEGEKTEEPPTTKSS
jgi:large subunit ribosomal protein L25